MKLLKTRIPFFPIWPARVELDGVQVPVSRSPLDPRSRRRLMRGSYEPAERDLVKQFIQSGDQILELGASIGIVTCFLSRQATAAGRIVSVEANAALRSAFEEQLRLNSVRAEWVNALCCPIWRPDVPAGVAGQRFQPSERSLSGRAVNGPAPLEGGPPWITAQRICERTNLKPTALVVDVEGAEAIWAEEPPNFPGSIRTAIVEFHPRLTGSRAAGRAVQSVLEHGFIVVGMRETVLAFQRK